MQRAESYTLPPLARLYDAMQQSGRPIQSRRSQMTRGSRSMTSASSQRASSRGSSDRRLYRNSPFIRPTVAVRPHAGDSPSTKDFEGLSADVPPPPVPLRRSQRKLARSPVTESSVASSADLYPYF